MAFDWVEGVLRGLKSGWASTLAEEVVLMFFPVWLRRRTQEQRSSSVKVRVKGKEEMGCSLLLDES